jgi:hypothetical protein
VSAKPGRQGRPDLPCRVRKPEFRGRPEFQDQVLENQGFYARVDGMFYLNIIFGSRIYLLFGYFRETESKPKVKRLFSF